MWDVMNLKLTEGKKPSEYDTLGNDTLIYLSEVYRGKYPVEILLNNKILKARLSEDML